MLVLPLPFGALAAWLDRMLMHTAAALTIRSLPTRLVGVLEGRAADCRGDAHLGRRETRPQAASDWGTSVIRMEWYLTTRLCASGIPLPPRGHETAMESLRGSSRQQAGALPGGDGCSGGQCAGIMPDLVHVGLGRVWGGALPRLAGDWPAVDWQPGVCVLEVAVEHDG